MFPFYPEFFGGNGWPDHTYVDSHGRGQDILCFMLLLWDTAFHADWFGGEQIGPFYLVFIPLLIFFRPIPRVVKITLIAAFIYSVLWFIVDPNIRFNFAGLAFMSVGVGWVISKLTNVGIIMARRFFYLAVMLMFGFTSAFSVYHFSDELMLLFNKDYSGYLTRNQRSYSVSRVINKHLDESADILSSGEILGFYYDNPLTLEGDFRNITRYPDKVQSVEELRDYLKDKGFTHILTSDSIVIDAEDSNRFAIDRVLSDSIKSRPYFKEDLVLKERGITYRLYEIK